jgi:hypothetical protein
LGDRHDPGKVAKATAKLLATEFSRPLLLKPIWILMAKKVTIANLANLLETQSNG